MAADARLFLLTASSPEAYQHYIDTIERGFTLESIKQFLTIDQVTALHNIYGDGMIRAWGATPGTGNIRTWTKMQVGDPILIYRKGNLEYYGFVTFKLHNRELAKSLWGTNAEGETWEHAYFLDQITDISVPAEIYNEAVGNQIQYRPYGFASMSSEKVRYVQERFGSIESFLNHLAEGKWVEKDARYPQEIKERIVQERVTRHIGKTPILEANLENFVAERVETIEPGLKLVGRQVDTREVGRLDLLCEDKNGDLVVVELKRGAADPSIIEQIQRYMGWAIEKRARPGQKVRGMIVVGSKNTALEYAVKANPMMQVKEFNLSIQ